MFGPTVFHLGWSGLLIGLAVVVLGRSRLGEPRPGGVLLQVVLALAVVGWSMSVLSPIARDRGPGLEVIGYALTPPVDGPSVLTLGTAAAADVRLADPHAASVHAVVSWQERDGRRVPMLRNALSERRLEVDGVGLHEVVLRSGLRIETLDGGIASGWNSSWAAG